MSAQHAEYVRRYKDPERRAETVRAAERWWEHGTMSLSDDLQDHDTFMAHIGALAVIAMERDYPEAEALRQLYATWHARHSDGGDTGG